MRVPLKPVSLMIGTVNVRTVVPAGKLIDPWCGTLSRNACSSVVTSRPPVRSMLSGGVNVFAGGVGGFFERMFAPRMMRRVYTDELGRLDRYAREQAAAGAA